METDFIIVGYSIILLFLAGVSISLNDLWRHSKFNFRNKILWSVITIFGGLMGTLLYLLTFYVFIIPHLQKFDFFFERNP